jgi:TatD DNase family protein
MGDSPVPLHQQNAFRNAHATHPCYVMIDSHCHLTDPRLRERFDDVLARARAAGVDRMVTIGTDLEDAIDALEICRQHSNVRCAIGIHPNHSGDAQISDIPRLRQLQADAAVLAIGEMGLDYHYDRVGREHQRRIFEEQLELAREVGKPVVIHCREAVDDTLALLAKFKSIPAVFHCFTGTVDEARRILDAGYLLGFTGPITYKTNDDLRAVVKQTPLDRLLVETDAPYLSPEPVRKIKTNEPSFVVHTAAVAAEVKGVSVQDIDRITTQNAMAFFRWT